MPNYRRTGALFPHPSHGPRNNWPLSGDAARGRYMYYGPHIVARDDAARKRARAHARPLAYGANERTTADEAHQMRLYVYVRLIDMSEAQLMECVFFFSLSLFIN